MSSFSSVEGSVPISWDIKEEMKQIFKEADIFLVWEFSVKTVL